MAVFIVGNAKNVSIDQLIQYRIVLVFFMNNRESKWLICNMGQ